MLWFMRPRIYVVVEIIGTDLVRGTRNLHAADDPIGGDLKTRLDARTGNGSSGQLNVRDGSPNKSANGGERCGAPSHTGERKHVCTNRRQRCAATSSNVNKL